MKRTREGSGVPASQAPEIGLTRLDFSISEYFFKVHQPAGGDGGSIILHVTSFQRYDSSAAT